MINKILSGTFEFIANIQIIALTSNENWITVIKEFKTIALIIVIRVIFMACERFWKYCFNRRKERKKNEL
jgi:hypothetical protein